jgi:hypothetical protein
MRLLVADVPRIVHDPWFNLDPPSWPGEPVPAVEVEATVPASTVKRSGM